MRKTPTSLRIMMLLFSYPPALWQICLEAFFLYHRGWCTEAKHHLIKLTLSSWNQPLDVTVMKFYFLTLTDSRCIDIPSGNCIKMNGINKNSPTPDSWTCFFFLFRSRNLCFKKCTQWGNQNHQYVYKYVLMASIAICPYG